MLARVSVFSAPRTGSGGEDLVLSAARTALNGYADDPATALGLLQVTLTVEPEEKMSTRTSRPRG